MPSYTSTAALVINKKTLKENDLLVTLLTPGLGKIITKAVGAKNIKSSRLGSLQLGNIIKVHLYEKNGQTWLSEAQTISSFLHHQKSLTQHNLLFYFLEFINQLVAENQHTEGLYDIAVNIVQAINDNNVKKYIGNEIELTKILGFGIPADILQFYKKGDYKSCQRYLKSFLESIIEKKLESNKLFR
ncbi:DNA repair protein RecO [Patescibacteria group bacterium]|nr:DNA repair protein RecO [Patescibacteria group bacterium]